jgi:hypothetical protein
MFAEEAKKGMDAGEDLLGDELALNDTYLWQDKYRPRKPRYGWSVHCVSRCVSVCPCPSVSLSCVPLCIPICIFGLLYFFTEFSYGDGMGCFSQVLQPCEDGLRLEQVQPDPLRPRQSAPQERAGLQVQHLLPRSDRPKQNPRIRAGAGRECLWSSLCSVLVVSG